MENSRKQNIYLIGMMGSWKSTVGKLLAERLERQFADTDNLLEETMKMSIPQIFKYLGEDRFRQEEALCLRAVSEQPEMVVATGGGIILTAENRSLLKTMGHTFFLKASPEVLAGRIRNIANRPKLHGPGDLLAKLRKLTAERRSFYTDTAGFIVDTDALTTDEVVDSVLEKLEGVQVDG